MKNKANPVSPPQTYKPGSNLLPILPCYKWQGFFSNWKNRKIRQNVNILFLAISILFFFPLFSVASERQLIKIKPNDSISFLCFMILTSKDYIEVKSGGRVELMMSEGRIIRLDENSTIRISALKRDEQKKSVTGRFKLFLGRLWGKVLKARVYGKKEMYVSTPTLVAGVRGTAYDLKLKPDQSTIIKVFEGEVEIYNPLQKMPESGVIKDFKKPHRVKGPHRVTEKEWNEILLRQYQQVIVTKEGITKPIIFDYEKERQTEWIKWNEERDIRLITSLTP